MKKQFSKLLQLGYWGLYAILLTVLFLLLTFFQKPPMNFIYWWRIMLGFAVVPGGIAFYASHTFLFSVYLRTRNAFLLLLLFILAALIATFAGMTVLTLVIHTTYLTNDGIQGVLGLAIPIAFLALVNGLIGFVIKGFDSWFHDIELKEELNQKNYEMELALIKSQLDPHFLFNTLNNIDILIEMDSAKASGYLNKLSDIMRFMLYDSKTDRIPLTKELDYIEKYIALQRVRTSNDKAINYLVTGEPGSKMIAPMLFIPFIENAFKHSNLRAFGAVGIRFIIEERKVVFTCDNLFTANGPFQKQVGGLGKELVERRLALLYPGKHNLVIVVDESYYRIKLEVEE